MRSNVRIDVVEEIFSLLTLDSLGHDTWQGVLLLKVGDFQLSLSRFSKALPLSSTCVVY